ncbi:MAG: ABC transporter substrate-binding protein [Betaproteobacteria bacterium]|nr:ABC transporter substrate-binding protein [Betaproteobacteria bacterium]
MRALTRLLDVRYLLALLIFLSGVTALHALELEKREVIIAVGGKATLYYLPLSLAEHLGYFKDEGLEVEINDFQGGSKALQSLIGGSADVVAGAFDHNIVMQTLAQKMTAFVLIAMNPGVSVGVVKSKAAGYRSPLALKGMRVGVTAPGSGTHMIVNHLLAGAGLTPDDIIPVGVGTGATAIAAVRGGESDAICNVEPAMTLLEQQGLITIVHETITDQGTLKVFGGYIPAGTLYTKQDFIRKYPNTVQALANGMVRALVWLSKATPEEVVNAVPPEYLLGDRALYLAALTRLKPTYSKDGLIPRKGVDQTYKVLQSTHQAVRRAPVLFLQQTFDNSFAQRALAKYH